MQPTPHSKRASAAKGPRRGRPTGRFTQHRRLDKLRDVLQAHPGGLALEDLASLLHVTTRSVRRYLAELDRVTELESIETTPGGAHLWRVKPSERGRAVALRRTQAYGLLAARRVFEVIKGSALFDELDIVLRQVTQIAQRPTRAVGEAPADLHLEDRFLYCPPNARSYASRADDLDVLFQCVAELRVLRFRHRVEASAKTEHERERAAHVERVTARPYALLVHRGAIHCVAHDVERNAVRAFVLDKMSDLAPSAAEHFALPADFDAADFVHGDFGIAAKSSKPTRVLVEFDPGVAERIRARRVHSTQKIATASDGRVRVSLAVPAPLVDEVRAWVLAFGGAARVIEPPELAADVANELRRALAAY